MRQKANRFIGINYINDNSKTAVPPEFWLQRLYDFDNQLVVAPSRHVPYAYVLARRRRLTAGLSDKALESTITQPDTKLCMQHGLVPVSLIYKTGTNWDIDGIIRSLKSRDVWAAGGGEAYADKADEADEQARQKVRKDIRDDMWSRAGDAWRSYQARTGQRNRHARNSGLRVKSSSGSTAGQARA